MAITLGRENPYKIFKSLNSTGEDLEEGDLIRNHVFMAISVADQDSFDDHKWRPLERHFEASGKLDGRAFAGFFRDALMRGGEYVGKDGVYEAFERAHPPGKFEPDPVVAALTQQVERYNFILGRASHPVAGVDAALGEINALQASTAYPLILALIDAHEAKKIDDVGLVTALKAISSFVLRRFVCGETSRAYGRWFCSACRELGEAPVQGVVAFLRAKGWPDDMKFVPAFKRMNLYSSKYDRVVISALELSLQRKSEPVGLGGCSIEHVLPQTIVESDDDGRKWIEALGADWKKVKGEWQDTPGNLTLVGDDYNKSMSNNTFEDKRPVLLGSKIYLNKYFEKIANWNAEEIDKRGQFLAELAAKVWPVPL
ncbi:MAG: HNH endonuclease family protein [Polyangiaceae bacterium]